MAVKQDEKVPNYFEEIAPTPEEVRGDIVPAYFRGIAGMFESMGLTAEVLYERMREETGGVWPPPWALEDMIGAKVKEEAGAVVEELQPEKPLTATGLPSQLASGAGSLTAFAGTAGAGAAVGAPAWLSVGLAGAMAEGGSAYEEVLAETGDEDKAFTALVVQGLLGGTTEAIPFAHGFGKLLAGANRASGGKVIALFGAYGASVIEEGGQEAWQQAVANVTAKYITEHDEGRQLLEGVVEAGGIGGILGLFGGGSADLLGRVMSAEEMQALEEAIRVMVEGEVVEQEAPVVSEAPVEEVEQVEPITLTEEEQAESLKDLGDVAKDQAEAQELREDLEAPEKIAEPEVEVRQPQEEVEPQVAEAPELEIEESAPAEPEQFQQEQKKRDDEAGRIEQAYGGAIPLVDTGQRFAKGLRKLAVGFRTRGDKPKKVQQAYEKTQHKVLAESMRAAMGYKDFIAARKRAGWDRVLTKEENKLLNLALRGERVKSGHGKGQYAETLIPKELRSPIKAMRRHIDRLSTMLIKEGVVEGELATKIAGNVGAYVTRSYRAHDDPEWVDKVPAEAVNRAKAWLRSNEGMSEEQADVYIRDLLIGSKESGSPIGYMSTLGSRNLGVLMKRKGIPMPLREVLGEYTEPEISYAKSVYKVASLIENTKLLREVKRVGEGKFLFKEEDFKARSAAKASTRISAEGNKALEPIDGMYATAEVAEALQSMMDRKTLPNWLQLYMRVNSAVKVGLTVGSYMTHIRNFWSNPMFALAQGHFGMHRAFAPKTWTAFTVGVGNMSNQEFREYYLRAVELGIVGQDVRAQELRNMFKDASKYTDPMKWAEDHARSKLKRAGRTVMDLYGAEDSFWKLYGWENEKARYKRAKPDWGEGQLEERTAEIVRDTFPTYEKIGKTIQELRRFPLVGSFVSFPAEVIRIMYRTYNPKNGIIRTEWKDPALRGIAAQRIAGSLLAASVPSVISAASLAMLGLTMDDEDDLRTFLPSWTKFSDLIWFKTKDGDLGYVDIGYHDPFAYIRKPLRALLQGAGEEEWDKRFSNAMWEFSEPFIGEEPLFGALMDIARNKREDTGGRVYIPGDPAEDRDKAAHLARRLKPGTIRDLDKLLKSATGATSDTGKKYELGPELLRQPTGMRMIVMDIPRALSFKARDYARRTGDATQILTKTLKKRSSSDDQIGNAYKRSEKLRRGAWDDMVSAYLAATKQGLMTDDDVFDAMRGAGVSETKADSILMEVYEPYYPTPQFLSTYIKTADLEWADELRRRKDLIAELSLEQ